MNSPNQNHLSCRQSIYQEDHTIEKEVDSQNRQTSMIEKIKIQIKFTSDQKIIYLQNRAILRVTESHDVKGKPELFNNMDQIHNLLWEGYCCQNKKKEGKWIAFWSKKLLKNVGGQSYIIIYILYYKAGLKYGLWKDLFLNYQDQAQIFEFGEYSHGQRIGRWNYIKKDKKIGGGNYNKNGQKQGKWIELDEGFYKRKQVAYKGEYNMNGMKVGNWDIMYKNDFWKGYQQIGGGSYDLEGNQKKIGKWTELDEGFDSQKQFTYNGEYNKNGMKVGKWDIISINYGEYEYIIQNIFSGGGQYDQEGNQQKIGKWTELDKKQFSHNGEYNMNGMKVGRWDIKSLKYGEYKQMQILIINNNIKKIVVGDHMIKKEIRKRLESGQNWMKGLIYRRKSLMLANMI